MHVRRKFSCQFAVWHATLPSPFSVGHSSAPIVLLHLVLPDEFLYASKTATSVECGKTVLAQTALFASPLQLRKRRGTFFSSFSYVFFFFNFFFCVPPFCATEQLKLVLQSSPARFSNRFTGVCFFTALCGLEATLSRLPTPPVSTVSLWLFIFLVNVCSNHRPAAPSCFCELSYYHPSSCRRE